MNVKRKQCNVSSDIYLPSWERDLAAERGKPETSDAGTLINALDKGEIRGGTEAETSPTTH